MHALLHDDPATMVDRDEHLEARLIAELAMLCRGVAHSSLPYLNTVRTVVQLPGDEAHERALRRVCAQIAGRYGVESSVSWAADAWDVCFSLPVADDLAALRAAREQGRRPAPVRARLAQAWVAMRAASSVSPNTVRGAE